MPRGSYTVETKLSVIRWHKDNQSSINNTSKHFDIDRKRVREWLLKEPELQANSVGAQKKKKRLSEGTPRSLELDDQVLDYLLDERADGMSVSNTQLMKKAAAIASTMADMGDFKASSGWLNRWKKRNRISLRRGTNESQKIPDDFGPQCRKFTLDVKRKRVSNQLTDYNLGNMDQTMVRFDMPRRTTNCPVNQRLV